MGVAAIGKAHTDGWNVTAEGYIGIGAAYAPIAAFFNAELLQNRGSGLYERMAKREPACGPIADLFVAQRQAVIVRAVRLRVALYYLSDLLVQPGEGFG